MFFTKALKLLSEVLAQLGFSATTSELTATARMLMEMDSRMLNDFQSSTRLQWRRIACYVLCISLTKMFKKNYTL